MRIEFDDGRGYVSQQQPVYCAASTYTNPGGTYGSPQIDASGNWVCDVATDPQATTDGLNMFDPADPGSMLGGRDPSAGMWDIAESFGEGWRADGSPKYYISLGSSADRPDYISSTQTPGGFSTKSRTLLALPLVLIGHSRATAIHLHVGYVFGGPQQAVYCANTTISDPTDTYYGSPQIDAGGNWVCDVVTDPNAATDGLNMFDPADPGSMIGDRDPYRSPWTLDEDHGVWPNRSPFYSIEFIEPGGGPVVSWPVGLGGLVLVVLAGLCWPAGRERVRRMVA